MTTHDVSLHQMGPFQPGMPFGAFQDQWLRAIAQSMRPTTAMSYQKMLKVTTPLHEKPLVTITEADINALYVELLDTASSRFIRHLHVILHQCLADAVQLGLIQHNPAKGVVLPGRQPAVYPVLTEEEARRLIQTVTDTPWEAIIMLAITTGIRARALLALQWSQVNLEQGWLSLGMPYHQSSEQLLEQRRKIPLCQRACQALIKQQAQQHPQDDTALVFPDQASKRATTLNMHEMWAYCEIANCQRIRYHDLRNTCASLLIGAAVPPHVVGAILGYHFQNAVDPLSPITDTMLREAADVMDQIFAPMPEKETALTHPEEDTNDCQ